MSQMIEVSEDTSVAREVHEAVDAFMTSLTQVGALRFNPRSRTYVLACEMSETLFHSLVESAKRGQTYRHA